MLRMRVIDSNLQARGITTVRRSRLLIAILATLVGLVAALVTRPGSASVPPVIAMLRSLGRAPYSAAGPYVGPDATNLDPPHIRLGPGGLPVVSYLGEGYQRNPVTVAQYGLTAYGRYLHDREATDRASVLRAADWLVVHQQRDGRWLYRFRLTFGDETLRPPWSSAMAQGQGMSLLERAFRLTGDRRYLAAAIRALAPLGPARSDLRRCFARNCGLPIFEEIPIVPGHRPTDILNGFMFTLIGLYDLSTVAPQTPAQSLYLAGRRTLVKALPHYDSGGLAIYSVRPGAIAPLRYQAVHVYLLRALDSITSSGEFRHYADRWQGNLSHAPA